MEKELLEKSMSACDAGRYDLAIRLGKELLAKGIPTGFYALGLVYAVLEDWHLAKENCLKAYEYFPNIPDNLNRLGVSFCQLGNIKQGLYFFKEGMDLGDAYCRENYNYWKNRI